MPSGDGCAPASPVMLQNLSATSSWRTFGSPPAIATTDVVRFLKSGEVRSARKCAASSHRRPPKPPPEPSVFIPVPSTLTTSVSPGTFSLIV